MFINFFKYLTKIKDYIWWWWWRTYRRKAKFRWVETLRFLFSLRYPWSNPPRLVGLSYLTSQHHFCQSQIQFPPPLSLISIPRYPNWLQKPIHKISHLPSATQNPTLYVYPHTLNPSPVSSTSFLNRNRHGCCSSIHQMLFISHSFFFSPCSFQDSNLAPQV